MLVYIICAYQVNNPAGALGTDRKLTIDLYTLLRTVTSDLSNTGLSGNLIFINPHR